MGSVSLRLVKVCRQIFWSCRFLSKVNMVVVKVQAKKVTGPVASSLPVTVRDTERDRAREAAASRLVQTHSMVAATVMLLVMSLTLLSLANFRDVGRENLCLRAQIAALQREKAVLECTARKQHGESLRGDGEEGGREQQQGGQDYGKIIYTFVTLLPKLFIETKNSGQKDKIFKQNCQLGKVQFSVSNIY